jgi:TonB family protein
MFLALGVASLPASVTRASEEAAPPPAHESPGPEPAGAKAPELIPESRIPPVYPEAGRQARVEGTVRLEAIIRKDGSVGAIRVLESPGKEYGFDRAAKDAVRRWKYLPALKDGQPVKSTAAITVEFRLPADATAPRPGVPDCATQAEYGIFWAGSCGVTNPVLIPESRIAPRYPEIGRKARVQGVVILQAVILEDGTVSSVDVLKSPGAHFGFDQAAIDAVRQWRYRPGLKDGRPVRVYFTVTVDFVLLDRAPWDASRRRPGTALR